MWPSAEKQSLSHHDEFKIEKLPSKPRYQFVVYTGDHKEETVESSPENVSFQPPVAAGSIADSPFEELPNQLFPLSPSNGLLGWGGSFGPLESPFLFQAFVDGFLKSVSPQPCHPRLLPLANFVPYALQSPIMMDVFNACGASFLSSRDPSMKLEAKKTVLALPHQLCQFLEQASGRR